MSQLSDVMLAAGVGEKIVGGGIDATVKARTSYSSFACTFEAPVPPGHDVRAFIRIAKRCSMSAKKLKRIGRCD